MAASHFVFVLSTQIVLFSHHIDRQEVSAIIILVYTAKVMSANYGQIWIYHCACRLFQTLSRLSILTQMGK